MNRELRAGAMLATIEDFRRTRCDELAAAALREAQALRLQAHVAARAKVRAALEEERARLGRDLARTQARLQTERRLAGQRAVSALLADAWPRLRDALEAAWAAPAARLRWAAHHLALAGELLPAERWCIRFAPGLDEGERARLAQPINVRSIEWIEDGTLRAGLATEADRNLLDATLEGLLADRRALESRLLALLEGDAK